MTPELILQKLGYLGVFIGTFFEGETILVIASFLSQRGYLILWLVILTAFLGAYTGHIFWFWIGRKHAWKLMAKFPHFKEKFQRVADLFERYGILAIFITQYLYGLRIASAVVFGLSRIRTGTFFFWQAVSCLLWAALIAILGYFFGHVVEQVLGQAASVEKWAILAIILIAVAISLYHRFRDRGEPAE